VNRHFVIITPDIQSGSLSRRVPATCLDRQGANAQSRADVVADRDNERSRRVISVVWVSSHKETP